jgi:hypothetical protein
LASIKVLQDVLDEDMSFLDEEAFVISESGTEPSATGIILDGGLSSSYGRIVEAQWINWDATIPANRLIPVLLMVEYPFVARFLSIIEWKYANRQALTTDIPIIVVVKRK